MPHETTRATIEALKPFRLVKFFSFTALVVILICTLILGWLLSDNAKNVMLTRSEAYAYLLAENLNQQVFQQFVVPAVLRYGEIALRNRNQFELLDTVVRTTTNGLKVDAVTLFDSKENIISYSTDDLLVGRRGVGGIEYEQAVQGRSTTVLSSNGSLLSLLPGAKPIECKLRTYIPFLRPSPPGKEDDEIRPEEVMGVTEIVQDLSADLEAVIRLQATIMTTSLAIMGALFAVLRFIVARADRIMEERAQERRRLEEKLHQAERLAGLGKMVTAVSHEIKNPLGIVRSTAEILGKRLRAVAPGNDHLANIIVEETTRLDGIVMEFLDFARPQEPNLTPCQVNEVIAKVLEFMKPEFEKHRITVIRELATELPTLFLDPNQLYRALLNILVNGVQAMPDGGTLNVASEQTAKSKGKGVAVTIADSGSGIPADKLPVIFNPFYTDKIRGTGLGLAIVKNIIDSHQGSIEVESEPGSGTTFSIFLPLR